MIRSAPRALRFVLLATLSLGLAAPAVAARSAGSLYRTARAREVSARTRLDRAPSRDGATLRTVRVAVKDYEAVVRRYPRSGYCDDALWRGAQLAADAFTYFGQARDRATAVRLIHWLQSEYPHSRYAHRAPGAMARSVPAPTPHKAPARPAPVRSAVREPAPKQPVAAAPSSTHTRLTRPAPGVAAPARREATDGPVTLTGITGSSESGHVRITMTLDREALYQEHRLLRPNRLLFDFQATRPAASLGHAHLALAEPGITGVSVTQQASEGRTQVAVDLAGRSSCSTFTLYNPYRLVLDCQPAVLDASLTTAPASLAAPPRPEAYPGTREPLEATRNINSAALNLPSTRSHPPEGPIATPAATLAAAIPAAPATQPAPRAPAANLDGGFSMARQLGLGISRIVIDPGHGGRDPGAQANGITESDLTLDIALRLEKLLARDPGIDVILTRRTDVYVPLDERTAIANRAGADLFLSIHANASRNAQAHGIETYFLNFASDAEEAAVAARENATSGETMGSLPDLVKAIALNNKLDESRDFATMVQRAMFSGVHDRNTDTRDLGVKQAPFAVLIGAAMPSVLAEISFLTNDEDAGYLKKSRFRDDVAKSLLRGILQYQHALKSARTTDSQ